MPGVIEPVIVSVRPALAQAWEDAGRPSLTRMVERSIELGTPLPRSTIHALLTVARGNPSRAYSGRLGIAKATALAAVLGADVQDVFEHTNSDPIRTLITA